MNYDFNDLLSIARQSDADLDFVHYSEYVRRAGRTENEFLIFLKPSLVAALVDGNLQAWNVIEDSLKRHAVELVSASVASGTALRRRRIIRNHYGTINSVSEKGQGAFDEQAHSTVTALKASEGELSVLGAHQFLSRYPDVSIPALTKLFDSRPLIRLSGGTYGVIVEHNAEKILLLNGFHPEQVEEFENPAARLLLFQGVSTSPWTALRHDMIGATDPQRARVGSLRQLFLERAERYGLGSVSSLRNGIHMSAGPLEGAVELARFLLEDSPMPEEVRTLQTTFGSAAEALVGPEIVTLLSENPTVVFEGRHVRAFDASEDVDAAKLLNLLRQGEMEIKGERLDGRT